MYVEINFPDNDAGEYIKNLEKCELVEISLTEVLEFSKKKFVEWLERTPGFIRYEKGSDIYWSKYPADNRDWSTDSLEICEKCNNVIWKWYKKSSDGHKVITKRFTFQEFYDKFNNQTLKKEEEKNGNS